MLEDIGPITQYSLKIALECYYSLEKSLLSVLRTEGDSDDEVETLDFDIQLQTAGTWGRKLLLGSFIGILLAAPHIIAALGNNQLSNRTKGIIVLVSVVANVFAGILATFGLKKSI